MKEIEKIIDSFTQGWKLKEEVIGAVLMGSYAMGLSTDRSDIDLHFLMSDSVPWNERGNKILNGFTIEYFATPIKHLKKLIERDNESGKRVYARMLAQSKIVFDKTGETAEFQIYARNELDKKLVKPKAALIEFQKYHIWDEYNKLILLRDQKRVNFEFAYYCLMDLILKYYAKFLCAELVINAKVDCLFTDELFRRKYYIKEFPDNQFIELFLNCLESCPNLSCIEELKEYGLRQMGGFEIDGWILKIPID